MTATRSYTISELADEFDVTTRTIRFYEEKGLLKPLREGQKRVYSVADRTRLRLILRGKRLGLSLNDSLEIIEMYDTVAGDQRQLQALVRKIRDRKQTLEQQLEDINASLIDLADVERRCFDALAADPKRKRSGAKRT